jgi:uncharacterized membrane protein
MLNDSLLFAQQALQLGSGYDWLMLVARVLHILGAIIIVGGLFYLWAVVTPSSPLPPSERPGERSSSSDHFFGGRRASWAKWLGIASALLLITGLWNFVNMVKFNQLHWSYHMLGLFKIILGLALMFLAALLAGRTNAADSIRKKWRQWLTVCLILGVITVAIGSVMRTYNRTPKPGATGGPTLIAP